MATTTLAKALNTALRDLMAEDERVLVFGEDVGMLGGVFRVTDGLQAAFVEGARAVGDPASAFQHGADRGVGLEALEFLEGIQVRVLVVEADHVADVHLVVFQVVQE